MILSALWSKVRNLSVPVIEVTCKLIAISLLILVVFGDSRGRKHAQNVLIDTIFKVLCG